MAFCFGNMTVLLADTWLSRVFNLPTSFHQNNDNEVLFMLLFIEVVIAAILVIYLNLLVNENYFDRPFRSYRRPQKDDDSEIIS
jgi:hypothetical protein